MKLATFEIFQGECVAIIGSSGSGKTTLLKIILGLIKPTEGKIYFDNIEYNKLNYHDIITKVGCVMQNDTLLSGTIAENITMFDNNRNEDKLIRCCRDACILDDILSLPMDFNSLVGDMGSNLSGGQLQRIYLSRALYKEPKLLFLDESTSHLDTINEKLINENINKLAVTKIIIAHRKETIDMADRVIDLDLM